MTDASAALGRRIRAARDRRGLTQEHLASAVGVDRSALAKIEAGSRRVSALELARIASTLGERIEWFVEDAPPSIVSRRASAAAGAETPVIDRYIEHVALNVEFVSKHTALDLAQAEPLNRPWDNQTVEAAAAQVRQTLGFGDEEPMPDITAHAARLGLLVFTVALGDETADGASVLLRQGGVAIVNGARDLGRRRLTAAHELGHYVFADEFTIDWRLDEANRSDHWENLLDRFARALLLPAAGLAARWADADTSLRTRAVRTASDYRVDMSTLARRIDELKLASAEQVDRVRQFRTTRSDFLELDLFVPRELEPPDLPRAYEAAVIALYRSEMVSAARALDLLLDTWTDDDLPELAPLPESAIWTFVS